jgi:hypothetical protein
MIRSVFCRVAVLACAVLLAPTAALPQAANAPDVQGRLQAQSGLRFAQAQVAQAQVAQAQVAQAQVAQAQVAQVQLAQVQLAQGCARRIGPFVTQDTAWQRWRQGRAQGYSLSNGIFPCNDQYGTRGYCFNVFLPC